MTNLIKLYADEHIHPVIVEAMRRRNVDVQTTQECAMDGADDEAQLLFAISEERAMLTQDADFLRLHAQDPQHHGIIYTQRQTTVGTIISGLLLIINILTADDMRNHIEFI